MSKSKEIKTNAMRILEKEKIPFLIIPMSAMSLLTVFRLRTSSLFPMKKSSKLLSPGETAEIISYS